MRLPALLTACAALQVGVAHAAPADCPAPYTLDALLGHLVAVETGLRDGDAASAHAAAASLEAGLPCLAELLPPLIAGRAYRAVGGGQIVAGDPHAARGAAWLRAAAELEPTFDYGLQDLPAEHPVRDAYRAARAAADVPETVLDRDFASGAAHFLDGRRLDAPRARPDRPHLLQRDDGATITWLVEGAAFPDDVLAPRVARQAPVEVEDADAARAREAAAKAAAAAAKAEAAAEKAAQKAQARAERDEARRVAQEARAAARAEAPAVSEPAVSEAPAPAAKARAPAARPTGSDGVVVLKRQRPPEKTPLLIGGTLVAALGGGLYALALDARGDFESATHQDDVHRHARQANRLVLASAAALAVGAGTLTWGVVLDGGTPLPTIRLRF